MQLKRLLLIQVIYILYLCYWCCGLQRLPALSLTVIHGIVITSGFKLAMYCSVQRDSAQHDEEHET